MPTEAEILLYKLHRNKPARVRNKTRISTEKALLEFVSYLDSLINEHVRKNKAENFPYIIPSIYRDKHKIKKQVEIDNYIKDSLCVANSCLKDIVKKAFGGKHKVIFHNIKPYEDIIKNFVFDLKPYVEYLEQKKNRDFHLFEGSKFYQVHAFELNKISSSLYWDKKLDAAVLDQRTSLNLACFTIRQSLEIKFKKSLGIAHLQYRDQSNVKLPHEFFPNFINRYKDDFNLPYSNLTSLIKIYKWTNKTIHSGISPKVWEIQFALKYIEPLFSSKRIEFDNGKRILHSLYGSIQINNYQHIKAKLRNSIAESIGNDDFILSFTDPEAVILS